MIADSLLSPINGLLGTKLTISTVSPLIKAININADDFQPPAVFNIPPAVKWSVRRICAGGRRPVAPRPSMILNWPPIDLVLLLREGGLLASDEGLNSEHVKQEETSSKQESSGRVWRQYFDKVRSLCKPGEAARSSSSCPPPPSLLAPPPGLLRASRAPHSGNVEQRIRNPEQISPEDTSRVPPDETETRSERSQSMLDGDGQDPVLILSDMNGTLLYRAKPGVSLPPGARSFTAGDPKPLQYCIRPGALDLVGDLQRHPRARFAFYTSMRKVNALPAARFLALPDSGDGGDPEVYDRPFNAPDPEGANHWDTMRNLPLIWSTPGRTGNGFGPHNTVMIEDTPSKMRYQEAGVVVVPEFAEKSVINAFGTDGGDGDRGGNEREVMPRLAAYLRRLLDESGGDVRKYIEQNPFKPHASEEQQAEIDFFGAVSLLLATGPLACLRLAVADTSGSLDDARRSIRSSIMVQGSSEDDGSSVFTLDGVDFQPGHDLMEFLQEACLAGERWGLDSVKMDKLRAWSDRAKVTIQETCP